MTNVNSGELILPPELRTWNGGKGGSGVVQKLVSMMPPHDLYIEPCLGGGKVLLGKSPSKRTLATDIDERVIGLWQKYNPSHDIFRVRNVTDLLRDMQKRHDLESTMIYLDPPYLYQVRSMKAKPIYKHEMGDPSQHQELIALATSFKSAKIMLSCYDDPLYQDGLKGWVKWQYQAVKRSGKMGTETVYQNFDPPSKLHDYRHIGGDYRERERIKKKHKRMLEKFRTMPRMERDWLLSELIHLLYEE
jgi:DNA adenine methylase